MSLRHGVEKHDLEDDDFFNGQCVCMECQSDGFYGKRKREGEQERDREREREGERKKRERYG